MVGEHAAVVCAIVGGLRLHAEGVVGADGESGHILGDGVAAVADGCFEIAGEGIIRRVSLFEGLVVDLQGVFAVEDGSSGADLRDVDCARGPG